MEVESNIGNRCAKFHSNLCNAKFYLSTEYSIFVLAIIGFRTLSIQYIFEIQWWHMVPSGPNGVHTFALNIQC